ncbi:general secretion pathway protein GspE [Myxococcus hansupus]|nr:general secretion pathway protein GspE [Myxococcus hansupus]
MTPVDEAGGAQTPASNAAVELSATEAAEKVVPTAASDVAEGAPIQSVPAAVQGEVAHPVSDSEAAKVLAESAYEAAQHSPVSEPRSDASVTEDAPPPQDEATATLSTDTASSSLAPSPDDNTPAVLEAPPELAAAAVSDASASTPDGATRPGESWSVIAVSSVDSTESTAPRPAYSDLHLDVEVTQPFGVRLESTDVEDAESSTEAPDDAQGPADAPTTPLKPRGFVVAEHGALLTTPVAPVIEHDLQAGAGASITGEVPSTPRAPIELDDLSGTSDEPMQLASTWEFVGWQGGDDTGSIGHTPETTWADRVVDLEGPAVAPAATEMPLASAWDFIQQPWQPQAQEPAEVITALLATAASASTEVPPGAPAVTAEQVLTALDAVNTQGTLGKVVLAYCAGRFQRAFLLGESLGLARVGHAWGPGSESEAVAGLKVDLEAPSLLLAAMSSTGPSVFTAPACAQDEAIFAALGGTNASHLAVIAIRNQGHAVAFIVADHGPEPVSTPALDELTRVAEKASDAFARLPTARRG